MPLQPGDIAPDFHLRADDKALVQLKRLHGHNVVLLFFPAAFTSVCTKELGMVRDGLKEYEALDARVFGISTDSIFALAKWKAEQGFNFPLLSDFNKTVCKKYDAAYKEFMYEMKGVAKRAAFVIDKNGVIRYAEVLENAGDIPNFAAVKSLLQSL